MCQNPLAPAGTPFSVRAFLLIALILSATLAVAQEPGEKWLADFQRYAAQENLQHDRPYAAVAGPALRWADLLKSLPAPEHWQAMRKQLTAAAEQQPDGAEKARLQTGGWLLTYLLEGKAAAQAALPEAPENPEPETPSGYTLANLHNALAQRDREEEPLEVQVQRFEQQLIMLEPVDVGAVKLAIGGEENFARLQRVIEAGKAMQGRVMAVYEEYERTQDEAAARAKMEALHAEFEAAHGADQEALEPFRNEPLLGRYMASAYGQDRPDDYIPTAVLPDLVTAVGAERAETLLRRALRLPLALGVRKESGEATLKLARELVRSESARLKAPSWGLALDTGEGALFEALLARFGEPAERDYDFQRARGYYLAGLIQQSRVPEAVALATRSQQPGSLDLPYDVLDALERGGQAEALWQFLREWLTRHPAAGEWTRFNRLSAQLDRQPELKTLLRELADKGAFAGMDRLQVQRMQAEAELATDELEAATKRLGEVVAPPSDNAEELKGQMNLVGKLLLLAELQGDRAAFDAAQAAGEAILEKGRKVGPEESLDLADTLATALNQTGRFADAGRVIGAVMDVAEELKKAAEKEGDAGYIPSYRTQNLVQEQLRALTGLERWADAERLAQESPWWSAGDVADLLQETVNSDRKPMGVHFAQIAAKQGKPELARRILEAQLVATPGVDAAYENYLALAGQEARPLLASLAETDRYQERPLIWQAKLHLDAGEPDRAVPLLEAAIAIDPSDGEQGRGDRMRVYALLAQASAMLGDTAKAAFLEGVVKAIRLSETADRWFDLGAYARAIRLYRESLGFFQDAYCIQSRLAVRLAGDGRMDEAVEHYRRAFELMPDSFGRVESHCFGCEHVFSGEQSQGVAEEVFTRMLAARPDKPQLHYLLGYLRQEQKRQAEAAEHYRKAVQLDPLYLNAWNKLAGLEQELKFTSGQRDDLMLRLTELDPGRRHVSPDLARVTDLARLWRALAEARQALVRLPVHDALWELSASRAAADPNRPTYSIWSRRRLGTDFGTVLGEHAFVQAIQQHLAALNYRVPDRN
jgi:tetratricopeptide (TPR) repeat protein